MVDKFVSVKAVKTKLDYIFRAYGVSIFTREKILEVFDKVPAAEVQEVRNGKWTETHEHINLANGQVKEWINFYCSECCCPNIASTDYCPYCGAKMESEDNDL